jgi:hypothetical protein
MCAICRVLATAGLPAEVVHRLRILVGVSIRVLAALARYSTTKRLGARSLRDHQERAEICINRIGETPQNNLRLILGVLWPFLRA